MQHVDDGRLEAWLDRDRSGMPREEAEAITRHLQTCAACADRQRQAADARARADEILGGSRVPGVAVPDFSEVVARARGTSAIHRPVTRTVRPGVALLWAASVVAAIGLGWLTRDLLAPRPIAFEQTGRPAAAEIREMSSAAADQNAGPEAQANGSIEELAPDGRSASAASLGAIASAAPTSRSAPEAASAAAPPAAQSTPVRNEAIRDPIRTITVPVPVAELGARNQEAASMAAASALSNSRTVVANGRIFGESGPLSGVLVSAVGGPATLTDGDGRFSIAVPPSNTAGPPENQLLASMLGYHQQRIALDTSGRDTVEINITMSPAPLSLDAIVAVGYGQQTRVMSMQQVAAAPGAAEGAAPTAEALPLQNRLPAAPAGQVATAGIQRRETIPAAEASRRLGAPILSLPDREVLSLEWVEYSAGGSVELRQRLPSGLPLRLLQSPASASVVLPPAEGQATVNIIRGTLHVSAQAEMSAESLRQLLEGLR